MSLWERERTRRARSRALEAKRLRERGLTWREVGERLGGVSRARAQFLGKLGSRINAERSARGMI